MRKLSSQEIQAVSGGATTSGGEQKPLPGWYVAAAWIFRTLIGKPYPLF